MKSINFGVLPDGRMSRLWTISNANGMAACITDVGACLVSLHVPNGPGSYVDVVAGYDGAAGYAVNAPNLGATIGRHANRIGGAAFELDGVSHQLDANEKGNNLHSGFDFWHRRLWDVVSVEGKECVTDSRIEFHLMSPDGDQGFPGSVDVHVTYELTDDDALNITYDGVPSATTVMNLTNHSYFNLNGHASGTALGHMLRVNACEYTPTRADLVPTGEVVPVEGSVLDLREPRVLRDVVKSDDPSIVNAKGLDHNFVLGGDGLSAQRLAATLVGDKTGIAMDVYTNTPGIQVYTANYLGDDADVPHKGGAVYSDWDAVCLETQFYPDAPNHPDFPQPIFGPTKPYRSRTTFAFRTE